MRPDGKFSEEFLSDLIREVKMQLQQEEVMNVHDVSQMLKVSRTSVDSLRRAGIIKRHTLGTMHFYLRSEIITAIKNS
jgi:hypothetical protein